MLSLSRIVLPFSIPVLYRRGTDAQVRPADRPKAKNAGRRLAPFESDPAVIAFAQTWAGRAVLAAVFGALLFLQLQNVRSVALLPAPLLLLYASASAWAFGGRRRQQVVGAIGIFLLIANPFLGQFAVFAAIAAREGVALGGQPVLLSLALGAATAAACVALVALARRYPRSLLAQRPVVTLVAPLLLTALLCGSGWLQGIPEVALWAVLLLLGPSVWFVAYAVTDQRRPLPCGPSRLPLLRDFWAFSSTPWGKGWTYLSRFEAKTQEQLAVTQLKGVRLLAWAIVLNAVLAVLVHTVHGALAIPEFASVTARAFAGDRTPALPCWLSLVSAFLENLLELSIIGHTAIAVVRFAGFRLLRNTYRPLEAASIAEFWNRYHYYFKELLVDFFFFPTFMRCFRNAERLRLCFATFMAAGVGNAGFHFLRDISYVATLGLHQAVVGFQTYAFYCLVLTAGICLSQLRARRPSRHAGWVRRRLVPCVTVSLFFCLLHVFDDTDRTHSLAEHASVLLQLFGV